MVLTVTSLALRRAPWSLEQFKGRTHCRLGDKEMECEIRAWRVREEVFLD